MNRFRTRVAPALFILTVLVAAPAARAEPFAAGDDEQILRDAGLAADGPALLAFFQARARLDVDGEQLRQLLTQFAGDDEARHAEAQAKLLGFGVLAVPALRQAANDLSQPQTAARAADCLAWLEGSSSQKLLTAAVHVLAQRKPEGAAAALLAYLPYADNAEIIAAVTSALAAVAVPGGKTDPALIQGLSDRQSVRRAASAVALCQAAPEQVPDVRGLLKDPAAKVRLRAAKALAEAKDAEAIPVLIDLLAELPTDERQPVEELLKELAGEWAPVLEFAADDAISRGVRRDAWASWWRRTDGPVLLAALAQHTLTPDKSRRLQELLRQLGSDDFTVRERISRQLLAFGGLALPPLREAVEARDAEVARRAKMLIERIEKGPDARLPLAALRLLAVRKPAGAVEALLAYLPFAEDEIREEELRKSLVVLARRDGQLDAALRRALADAQPKVRVVAAEVLIEGGGPEGRAAVRKLLKEDKPSVCLRAALALARAGERAAVAVLIDLLPLLSAEECSQVEMALQQLAGDTAPNPSEGTEAENKKKRRDAWASWWKLNAPRADLGRLNHPAQLGYTLVCTILPQGANDYIYEVDRHGKKRWTIANLSSPTDAVVLSGNRVLIAEVAGGCVSERDFQGRILWGKDGLNAPFGVQRLANGNTFIACQKQLVEVDRAGKELYAIDKFADNVAAAYRSRTGAIICLTGDGQCRFLDTTGKQLRGFASKHPLKEKGGDLALLPNGRILITSRDANKVAEYDGQGNLLHEWDVPGVSRATGLPNGHVLASTDNDGNRVVELDRAGKIVWEHKGDGPVGCIRRR